MILWNAVVGACRQRMRMSARIMFSNAIFFVSRIVELSNSSWPRRLVPWCSYVREYNPPADRKSLRMFGQYALQESMCSLLRRSSLTGIPAPVETPAPQKNVIFLAWCSSRHILRWCSRHVSAVTTNIEGGRNWVCGGQEVWSQN
jgi:hypothetical protein